jgi:DNA-3-methyladenine glycosylase I
MSKSTTERCPWCGNDPLYTAYHDEEWGIPCHDEHKLFEHLLLEGAQAGLAWITILRKRETYRAAFDNFDAKRIAAYGDDDAARLLADPGIVRNRLKVAAFIRNANAYLDLCAAKGGLDAYLWDFVDGQQIVNRFRSMKEVPAKTALSDTISKDLQKRGFKFVGSTIVYAYLQAVGVVNDHLVSCHRHTPALLSGINFPNSPRL